MGWTLVVGAGVSAGGSNELNACGAGGAEAGGAVDDAGLLAETAGAAGAGACAAAGGAGLGAGFDASNDGFMISTYT